MFDLFNYKKVCEQAGYIRFLEQKLYDTQLELSKYKQINFYPFGIHPAALPPAPVKQNNIKKKEKIGFSTGGKENV